MEPITMTKRDLLCLQTAQRVLDGARSVAEAAADLGLSTRQIKRLTRRLRVDGAAAFRSARASKPPNNAFDPAVRELVLERVRTTYSGFGPTFLAEKLAEREGIEINRETLRQWLIAANIHRARKRRLKPRPMRERRPRFGELVQADGSPHRWFEDRAGACTLLLCVDDATTRILGGRFAEHETTNDYFQLFEDVFSTHGLPVALYTDKHGIFRVNDPKSAPENETHVQRALRELDVDLICANSPQAKGRVERANRSLQDRLVKELRLAGISSMDEANAFLPGFLDTFNRRFAVAPASDQDAHRPTRRETLATTFIKRFERTLNANLTFQINDRYYTIETPAAHRLHRGMRVIVCLPRQGEPFVLHNEQRVAVRYVGSHNRTGRVTESKRVNEQIDRRLPNPKKAHIPPRAHPWRNIPLTPRQVQLAGGHL